MKRRISIFTLLCCAFAAVAAVGEEVMRLSPIGYRLGETGDVTAYASGVVTVAPSGTSIVKDGKPITLTAALNRDYKVICWQKFDVNPTIRKSADPIEEFGKGAESVSVAYDADVQWMYVVVVVRYDPVRTVKAALSSFGKGKVTVDPQKDTYLKDDAVTLTAEPDEGYSFVRWSDGNADFRRTLTVDGDVDLTAYIEPATSRVTFSPGEGAAVGMTEKRVSYDSLYGELPVPTRTGFVFSGWMDEDKRTISAKTSVSRIVDHMLHALWESEFFEIAWGFDGEGNGRVDGTGTYAYGSQPTLKAVPYEGSAFVRWEDGETRNPRRIAVISNATYVAWFDVATYDVTFIYRDESGNLVTTAPASVKYGGKIDPPAIPEWPEHKFANWSTEEYRKVMRDLKVEALYNTTTYSVVFAYRDWQGNCVTTMPQHVASGGRANPPDRSVVDNWTGNTFKGWQPDYNVIGRDTLCEALYAIKTYSVKFSYRGKDGEPRESVEMVEHGGTVQAVPETAVVDTWPGHRFLGWSNDAYLSPITGNLDVIARYEGYCEIDYKDALGTNLVDEVKDPKDWTNLRPVAELNEVEGYTFEKTGYMFGGWKTTEAGDVVYEDGARVRVQSGDVLALVSKWDPIQYKVGFDLNGGKGYVPEDRELTYDTEYTTYGPDTVIPRVPSPAPDGMSLDKAFWTAELNNTNSACYKSGDTISNLTTKADGRIILHAYWPKNSYDVKIDDGHGGTKTVSMEYGAEIGDPGAPAARAGYQFAGWLTNDVAVEEFPITVPINGITLKADWAANEYTVGFHGTDADDGTMEPQKFTYDVEQALTPNGFTRTGYTFANWTNEVGKTFADGERVKNLAANDGAVVDLYATWTMNPRYYAVRFNPNGGADDAYVQDIERGVETALTPNRFTRTGYGFANWTNATGTAYADGAKVTDLAAENETNDLYAAWTPNRYWVKFDGNGADGGKKMENQEFTYDEAKALTKNTFTRTGYGFAGWVTNLTASAVFTDEATVSNLTAEPDATNTLWAKWNANQYKVVYHGPDGATSDQDFTYDQSQKLKGADTFAPPAGWMVFAGWTNAVKVYAADATVSNLTDVAGGTVDLYAKWTDDSYTVDFDGNGATGGTMDSQVFEHGESRALNANEFKRTGHTFAKWTGADGKTYDDKAEFTAPASGIGETLQAVWTAIEYECLFDGQSDGKKKYGEKITRVDPSKTGYTFEGWTLNGGDVVDLSTFTMPDHDVAFTSKWKPITYTIAFDGNGTTTVAMAPTNVKYGVEFTLPSNTYVWTGHEFVQWTNSVGETFRDGETVKKNLATTDGATVTLYAQWQEKGNPLAIALGLDANFEVEVSEKGAWTVIDNPKDHKGLKRGASDPNGVLRIFVPSASTLSLEIDLDGNAGNGLSVYFNGKFIEKLTQTGSPPSTPYEPDQSGWFEFSGTPDAGHTWILKNFKWTAK